MELSLSLIFLFAGCRFTLAGTSLLLLAKKPFAEWRQTPKKILLLFALSQTLIQYIFFYIGIAASSASLSALLVSTGSFWWVILAPLILKTKFPTRMQWLSLLIGCIGVCIVVFSPNVSDGDPLLGSALLITATFFGAIAILLFQRVSLTMGGKSATGFSQLIGGLGLMAIGFQAWSEYGLFLNMEIILATAYLAFVSATAFSIWNHLTTIHPIPLLAAFRFLIPVCGVAEAFLFLENEGSSLTFFIGAALVVVAMVLASFLQSGVKAQT